MTLEPSLHLLDGFQATRSAMLELEGDAEFALWLELRPRLISDPLDGCLYLAADHVLSRGSAKETRRALLSWVTGSRGVALAGLSTDDERHALDGAIAAYLRSGRWRRDVSGLVPGDSKAEPPAEVATKQGVASDLALPRAKAAARGGGRHASERALLLFALEHLRLDEDTSGQVRRSIEQESTLPLMAWPLDLVRELDEALARQVRRLR